MVKIDLIGFNEFALKASKAPDELKREASAEVAFAAEEFAGNAKRDSREAFDQGQLMNGIKAVKVDAMTYDVISTANHSPYVEFGTKGRYTPQDGIDASEFKGKGDGTMAQFIEAIRAWVKRKGIKGGRYSVKTHRRLGSKDAKQREDDSLVMAIVYSILKRGVPARPFFFKQREPVMNNLIERLKALMP